MLTRFAALLLFLTLNLPACEKYETPAKNTPIPNQSPAPAATPRPSTIPNAIPAAASASPKPAAIDLNAQVVIFGYHRFVNNVKHPDTEITPAAFEAQMKELKDKGVSVIGLQDFLAWKRGEKAIPARAAILTLDDGWRSQYDVAWPILKKYGYPHTMFIYTEGVRGGHYGGGEAISWEQLAEMRDAGVDIQAHSETHPDLRKPYDKIAKKKLSPPEYEQWLENEIGRSKRTLEEKLGIRVNCFAVPYGNINDRVREVAKKEGYEAVFTVYGQRLVHNAPNNSLGRYLIEANKPKVFAEAINFSGAASSGAAPVEEIGATELSTQPANGETVKTALPLIKANLASMGPLENGSVQMRVSGLGLVPATYDAKAQTIAYQVTQRLRDKTCTVFISAKSGGKKVEAHWAFTIDENSSGAPANPSPAGSRTPAKK
jgi:peptidoglycan/xylan/chitin deacetylase (PgdA/CDA1 family)